MASRTLFSLRVIRCPACHARLPVHGGESIVACEYCDARVQIQRHRSAPPPHPLAPTPHPVHTATPHYSGFAWIAFVVPLLAIGGSAVAFFVQAGGSPPWADHEAPPAPVQVSDRGGEPDAVVAEAPVLEEGPSATGSEDEGPGRVGALFQELEERAERNKKSDDPEPSGPRRAPAPRQPRGPVLGVPEAKKQLEPKVLQCMKAAAVHHVTARMGNKSVGGVSILTSAAVAKPRVDGTVVNLPKTKLGRCIDAAGKTVSTRAFKSNYIIIDVRNPSVPDPLGDLPKTPSRDAVAATVSALDDRVHACAEQHGERGRKTNLHIRYDGPSGKLSSVNGSYTSKSFNRCVRDVYRSATFPKARQHEVTYTHRIEL